MRSRKQERARKADDEIGGEDDEIRIALRIRTCGEEGSSPRSDQTQLCSDREAGTAACEETCKRKERRLQGGCEVVLRFIGCGRWKNKTQDGKTGDPKKR